MSVEAAHSHSVVLGVLKTLVAHLRLFNPGQTVRVYAGGGVRAPTPVVHPFAFHPRGTAFPLVQELLIQQKRKVSPVGR